MALSEVPHSVYIDQNHKFNIQCSMKCNAMQQPIHKSIPRFKKVS